MKMKVGDVFYTWEGELDGFPISFHKHKVKEVIDYPPAPYYTGSDQYHGRDCFPSKLDIIKYFIDKLQKMGMKEVLKRNGLK